jgi:hypothetical protein
VPYCFEQFVDMFTVTTEQQTVADEDRLKVPPFDCSPGIEVYRGSARVKSSQRLLLADTDYMAPSSALLSVETSFTPLNLSEDTPMISFLEMDMKKYKYVPCDSLHDSPAAFTNGGGPSEVPDKSVVAFVGVQQPGDPSATATTDATEPGHSVFPPLAGSGDSAIYGVTDKSVTAVSGAPGAEFATPVHANDAMVSEYSGLSTQSRDGAQKKFSVTDKSAAAAGGIPCDTATSAGATPPSSSGSKDPARPLTTAGISFRSVVSEAASRGGGSGSGN